MSDSIQVRDLIEMLQRIEDKSAPVVMRHLRKPPIKGCHWHEELKILTVERTGAREWSVMTESPTDSLAEELVDSCDLDNPEKERAEKAENALIAIWDLVGEKLSDLDITP
jgi:hypothetical protein